MLNTVRENTKENNVFSNLISFEFKIKFSQAFAVFLMQFSNEVMFIAYNNNAVYQPCSFSY